MLRITSERLAAGGVVLRLLVPTDSLILLRGGIVVETIDRAAIKNGTSSDRWRVNGIRSPAHVTADDERVQVHTARQDRRRFEPIVGTSPALESVLAQIERVAPTDSTVLIQGETGTGKELIAQSIHQLSVRCGRTFVKLNCAAIPHDLLESELFGHERGAFTGALAQKIGRFELAHRGTLFLDEVGDLPASLQPKLLRVLQEQEFERLGSNQTSRVDVRLVAATNRDLTVMARRAEFRLDLYYRLNVFPITVPPLRDRREDIPALVTHWAERCAHKMQKPIVHIPANTMDALSSYSWPGNIRELQNLIERAVILSNDGVLPNLVPPAVTESDDIAQASPRLKDAQRALIIRALEAAGWVIGGSQGAAAQLDVNRTTLINKMKRLGISRPGVCKSPAV
jgi:transcriptional regulator with GAF, ATPase, and Fis domain